MEKNENLVTENYFKSAISRLLIFWEIEKIISKSPWYSGGFRAQTVAYTLSAFSYVVERQGKVYFNFETIWEKQVVPEDIVDVLEEIAKMVHLSLLSPNSRYGNVSVFAKKKDCWEIIKNLNYDSIYINRNYFIEQEEFKKIEKYDIRNKNIDEGLDKEILVYKTDYKVWASLREFYANEGLSDFQIRTLKKYSIKNSHIPSQNETTTLYKLLHEAKRSGFSE
jgi:hypothetical protein